MAAYHGMPHGKPGYVMTQQSSREECKPFGTPSIGSSVEPSTGTSAVSSISRSCGVSTSTLVGSSTVISAASSAGPSQSTPSGPSASPSAGPSTGPSTGPSDLINDPVKKLSQERYGKKESSDAAEPPEKDAEKEREKMRQVYTTIKSRLEEMNKDRNQLTQEFVSALSTHFIKCPDRYLRKLLCISQIGKMIFQTSIDYWSIKMQKGQFLSRTNQT